MTARTCQSCKHYEPSAVWRRGFCRNPRLYSPQQSHLVEQDALDCSRGLGSAWEAAEADDAPVGRPEQAGWQPLRLFAPQPQLATTGVVMMASSNVGGGSGTGSAGGSFAGPPRPDRPGPPAGQERTVSYQPEERYWTDYLRIALPVAGLLLLLAVTWYWASELIGGGDDGSSATQVALGEVSITASPTAPAPTATSATIEPTPGTPPTPTPTVPAQQPAQQPVAEATTPAEPEAEPVSQPTREADGDSREFPVYETGATVRTTESVRMREEANVDAGIVVEVAAGTELRITGNFVDGGQNEQGEDREDWWPVTNPSTNQSGFIREDFLEEQ